MGAFGGGFMHGLGIDNATTGAGSGEFGIVSGISEGKSPSAVVHSKATTAKTDEQSILLALGAVVFVFAVIFLKGK